jgi:hypothetical protein
MSKPRLFRVPVFFQSHSVTSVHRSHVIRSTPLFLFLALLVGCAHDDARLHGTWRSNQEAAVAAAFQRDPRWTNAPPEKVERFREMFGHLTLTYSNGVTTSLFHGKEESWRYQVVERGTDFVVIHSEAALDEGRDIRIRFVDDGAGYWIDTGPLGFDLQERFDRVTTSLNKK